MQLPIPSFFSQNPSLITELSETILFHASLVRIGLAVVLSKALHGKDQGLKNIFWLMLAMAIAALFCVAAPLSALGFYILASVSIFAFLLSRAFPIFKSFGLMVFCLRLYCGGSSVFLILLAEPGIFRRPIGLTSFCLLLTLSMLGFIVSLLYSELAIYSKLCLVLRRRNEAFARGAKAVSPHPFVSIHVPCHAEPPAMVRRTLAHLAALDYANYEVIVLDNNTAEEHLWRPIRQQCLSLGARFKFLHCMGVKGAKAGALNIAFQQMNPKAEFICVVDADYAVLPGFLIEHIGLFADPALGFVQTSHDYRQWRTAPFTRSLYPCMVNAHKRGFPMLNEMDAAFTVGTMCIYRRQALETMVGPWAEWCLTEDSEISIRLHAQGYTGQYLGSTWGTGLLPTNLESLKKQQFRWTAGPIQQFKRHWRLFFGFTDEGCLSAAQKINEIIHSFNKFPFVFALMWNIAILGYCGRSIQNNNDITAAGVVVFTFFSKFAYDCFLEWAMMRNEGLYGLRNFLLASAISRALRFTFVIGSIVPFFTHNFKWHRTSKFENTLRSSDAWRSAVPETILGTTMIILAAILLDLDFDKTSVINFTKLGALWIAFQGVGFCCTIIMAWIGITYSGNEVPQDFDPKILSEAGKRP